jgi:DNA-binding transcriptional ArsR family regulator
MTDTRSNGWKTELDPAGLDTAARLFRGFGDTSRLAILETLRYAPRSVGEIVEMTELSQPNTSNHLGCLYDCGLVTREQRGRHVFYELSDHRVAELLDAAHGLLAEVARGVEACERYGDGASS